MDVLFSDPGVRAYFLAVSALLGAVMGSFLTCLADRAVRGESVLTGRSRCDACGHVLGVLDLIPIFSWLLLRGRCRHCGAKIPARCVLVEGLCAVLYASLFWRFGFSLRTLGALVLASALLAASLIDLDTQTVPDKTLLAGLVAFVLWLADDFSLRALGAAVGNSLAIALPLLLFVLAFDKLRGQESMGGGDLKLFALLGLFFPWQQGLLLLILACALGLLLAALLGKAKPGTPFPFAPAICLSAWLTALFGEGLISWYLGLLFRSF